MYLQSRAIVKLVTPHFLKNMVEIMVIQAAIAFPKSPTKWPLMLAEQEMNCVLISHSTNTFSVHHESKASICTLPLRLEIFSGGMRELPRDVTHPGQFCKFQERLGMGAANPYFFARIGHLNSCSPILGSSLFRQPEGCCQHTMEMKVPCALMWEGNFTI